MLPYPPLHRSSITSFVPHYRAAEEHNELDFVQAFIMPWSCLMNYAGSFLYEALAVQVILLVRKGGRPRPHTETLQKIPRTNACVCMPPCLRVV